LAVSAVVACGVGAGGASADGDDGDGVQSGAWTQHSRTHREGRKNITVVYGDTVNYRNAHGDWQSIDDTLVGSSSPGYAFENKADGYKLRIPADLATSAVQLDLGQASIGFALRGARGHGSAHGSTANFAGALSQTDVSYTATSRGAHELLTLASLKAPSSFTYDLQLRGGLSAQQIGPRAIAFVKDGKAVAYFVAPSMYDSAGARSSGIAVSLNGESVTVTPDRSWLTSPDRVWPVTIDPDVFTFTGANQDTYIASGSPDTYFGGDPLLRVGYDGTQAIRGLLNFQLNAAIPAGAKIDSAQLALYLESQSTAASAPVSVYNVVARWSSATWNQYDWDYQARAPLPWNTRGGDIDASLVATAIPGTIGSSTNWDVTQLVQKQVSGLVPPYGFLMKQQDESTNQVLGFNSSWSSNGKPVPTLTVTWESSTPAGQPAVTLIGGNGVGFGSAPVGSSTPTQEVGVSNSGSAPLTVSSLVITGANSADFAVKSSTCTSGAVQPGATCTITLSATPGAAGNRSATLVITDNAPNSPQNVALTVTGTAPANATVEPSSLAFGTVRVGTTSATQTVTVTSTGGAVLSISGVSRSGSNARDFSIVSNTCSGAQLSQGQSCTVGVRARPRARGPRNAMLRISDNVVGGQAVPLTVTGS
jgi:hypothetical protein